MAFKAGAITGDIFLNPKPGVDAIRTIMSETRGLKVSVDQSMSVTRDSMKNAAHEAKKSWEDTLHGLKGSLGKRSILGESVHLLAGGGVIGGAGLALNELKEATKATAELVNEFRQGKIEAGEMFEKIGSSLPLLGSAYQIGRNFREAFTGEGAKFEEEMKALEHIVEMTDLAKEHIKAFKASFHEAMESLKASTDASNRKGLLASYPGQEARIRIGFERDDAIAAADKAFAAADPTEKINSIRKELDAFNQFNPARRAQLNNELGEYFKEREKLYQEHNRAVAAATQAAETQMQSLKDSDLHAAMGEINKVREQLRLLNATPNEKLIDEFAKKPGVISAMVDDYREALENLTAAQKAQAAAQLESNRAMDAAAVVGGLREQLEQSGMDQWQKMYDDIRRKPFMDMSALKDAKSVIDGLKEAARNLDLKNKADALKETLLTPQQRLEKTLGQYRDELKAGFLTPDQFTKGAMMARESILGQEPRLGNFIASGSAESLAVRYDARFNAGRQKSGRDWAERQLEEAEKHTSLLGKLVSQGNNPEEVVDMPTA